MSNKLAFIQKIAVFAIADMKNTFIPASLIIAQAALESAWGTSGLTKKGNNLFGIKGKGPAGSCTMKTTEYVKGKPIKVDAAFRAYNNWGESIADHTKLILGGVSWNKNLYKKVIGVDGKTAAREIQKAGYATDPKYADKLIALMDEFNLYQYDVVKGAPNVDKNSDKVNVIVNGKKIKDGKLIDDVTYVPLRAVGEALGAKIGFDNKTKTATLETKI
ncbi:glucosaminidase domain-containing protein [Paenibacillus lautus]|uniref:glucosaminidase domain-containing protein n=1 Tax=Paenibacillus lautus TaxID=1401 RepID=UPI003D2B3F4F